MTEQEFAEIREVIDRLRKRELVMIWEAIDKAIDTYIEPQGKDASRAVDP